MELRPAELLKQWKAGAFKPAYYLVGEDAAAKQEAVEDLKKRFGADDFNLREFSGNPDEEADAIVSEAATLPAFSDRRLVIVRAPKIPAAAKAALAEYLKDPLKSTTLVLFCDDKKPDAKDPLVKACAALGGLCVFSALGEDEAQSKLLGEAKRLGKALSEEAAALLVAEAGTDWTILGGELEKVALFVDKAAAINADDVLACLGYQKAADPFALTRLIQDRRLADAMAHLRRLMKDGKADEQAFFAQRQISNAILRQVRARRMQRAQVPPEQIARTLRLHPYWDRDYLPKLSKLSEARLRRDLKRCLAAETALKSKSWLDPRMEIEQLVIDVCR